MGTRLCTCGLGVMLVAALVGTPVARAAPPGRGACGGATHGDLVDLTAELRERVARASEAEAQCLQRRVAEGLPPAALLVVLDAIDEGEVEPMEPMIPVAWDLARHRRAKVRSRALMTLAGFGAEWSHRAAVLAMSDRDLAVRTTGYRLAAAHPNPRLEASLIDAFERGEPDTAAGLAACATQAVVMRLPGLREQVSTAAWVRLVGALVRRPDLLTPIQRLGLVTALAALRTPESLDELRALLVADVALDEPTARNLAARAVGLPQDPKRSRRRPKAKPNAQDGADGESEEDTDRADDADGAHDE